MRAVRSLTVPWDRGDVGAVEEHVRNLIAAGVTDLPFDRFKIQVG